MGIHDKGSTRGMSKTDESCSMRGKKLWNDKWKYGVAANTYTQPKKTRR
jgi:hypothetical protein